LRVEGFARRGLGSRTPARAVTPRERKEWGERQRRMRRRAQHLFERDFRRMKVEHQTQVRLVMHSISTTRALHASLRGELCRTRAAHKAETLEPKISTSTSYKHTLGTPRALHSPLRGFRVSGLDYSVYIIGTPLARPGHCTHLLEGLGFLV
jgi:hypothetical protein